MLVGGRPGPLTCSFALVCSVTSMSRRQAEGYKNQSIDPFPPVIISICVFSAAGGGGDQKANGSDVAFDLFVMATNRD